MGLVSFGPVSAQLPGCGVFRWNASPGHDWYWERFDAHWETFWAMRHFGADGSSNSAWRNCVHRFVWATRVRPEMSVGWAMGDESTRSADVWSVRIYD